MDMMPEVHAGRLLKIGHSPDPDDAFMWYPLAQEVRGLDSPQDKSSAGALKTYGGIDTRPYLFRHVLEDIQSLNERAERAELEITAISIHQYPFVAKDYALTSCGSSMGDGYGPMVVVRQDSPIQSVEDLFKPNLQVAIPGQRTTAALALWLLLGELGMKHPHQALKQEVVMFDQIIPAVARGEFDAGLIIHEGQLTFANAGLRCVVDLGQWWKQSRGLPLPLGGNAIRRDLGEEMSPICKILLASIRHALANRDEAIQYALNYARDMGKELADQFVGMYVNDWTLDYGPVGREAVCQLLGEGAEAGLVPDCGNIDFIEPG